MSHHRYPRRASTARTYPPGVTRDGGRYRVMVSYQDRDVHLAMTPHYDEACRYAVWGRKILGQKIQKFSAAQQGAGQPPVWFCLLTWRKAKGKTQRGLARTVGMRQNDYTDYERGLWVPRLPTLLRIAEVYDLTVGQLLGQEAQQKVVAPGVRTRGSHPDPGFGQRLAELRERAGLSQQVLADRAELSPRVVSRLERGDYGASFSIACRLAAALGVPTDALAQPLQPADLARA